MREKARESYNKVRLERYNYYTGKAPQEVYVEEPFPYKIREKDALQRHIEADEKLNAIDMKIRYYDVMLKFLEEVIKNISNRTFQIKTLSNGTVSKQGLTNGRRLFLRKRL